MAAHGEMNLVVVSALAFELLGVARTLKARKEVLEGLDIFLAPNKRDIVLAAVGMGRSAEAGATSLLSCLTPKAVIVVGFAAALKDLNPGHLIFYRRVSLYGTPGVSLEASPQLLEMALSAGKRAGLSFSIAEGLTVDRVLDGGAKKALQGSDFTAADMESYWVLREAFSRKIPGLAVRAVSDGPHDEVPFPSSIIDAGGNLKKTLFLSLISSPKAGPRLLRLIPKAFRARRSLTSFLVSFLEVFPG